MTITSSDNRTLRDEALEQVLDYISGREDTPDVCIQCWAVWDDGACTCDDPTWWPYIHAIRRLEAMVG